MCGRIYHLVGEVYTYFYIKIAWNAEYIVTGTIKNSSKKVIHKKTAEKEIKIWKF